MEHAEDVLSRAPLFEALDDEGAKALRSLVTDVDLVRAERLFDEGDSAFGNFVCEMKLVENFKLTYGSQLRLLPRRKRVHANIGIRKVANLRTRLARSVAQKRKCGRK